MAKSIIKTILDPLIRQNVLASDEVVTRLSNSPATLRENSTSHLPVDGVPANIRLATVDEYATFLLTRLATKAGGITEYWANHLFNAPDWGHFIYSLDLHENSATNNKAVILPDGKHVIIPVGIAIGIGTHRNYATKYYMENGTAVCECAVYGVPLYDDVADAMIAQGWQPKPEDFERGIFGDQYAKFMNREVLTPKEKAELDYFGSVRQFIRSQLSATKALGKPGVV